MESNFKNKAIRAIEIIYRYKYVVAISFITIVAIVLFFTLNQKKIYEASVTILVQSKPTNPFEPYVPRNLYNELEILQSKTMQLKAAEKVLERFYLDVEKRDTFWVIKEAIKLRPNDSYFSKEFKNLIAFYIGSSISIYSEKNTDIIKFSYKSYNPIEAAEIANIYADCYRELDLQKSRAKAAEARVFLEEHNRQKMEELKQTEANLKEFLTKEMSASIGNEEIITKRIFDLKSKIEEYQLVYQQTSIELEQARKELNEYAPNAVDKFAYIDDLYIVELQKVIAKAEAEKDIAKVMSSESLKDPNFAKELIRQEETIRELRKRLEDRTKLYLENLLKGEGGAFLADKTDALKAIQNLSAKVVSLQYKLNSLEESISALKSNLKDYEEQLRQLPEKSIAIEQMRREKKIKEKIYLTIGEKYQEAALAESSDFGIVQILAKADVPTSPIGPSARLNVMLAGFFGLSFGIFLAFVLNSLFGYVRSPADIERLGYKVLTVIPNIKKLSACERKLLTDGSVYKQLPSKEEAIVYESYLRLAINLTYVNDVKKLLITSPIPESGKSSTTANLALTLVSLGKKVLIIDADLQKPTQQEYFNLQNEKGLKEYLISQIELSEAIQKTKIEKLDVITSGFFNINPALVLNLPKIEEMMNKLSDEYDVILIDTPPLIPTVSAIQLTKFSDQVVFVVCSEKTKGSEIEAAKKYLENLNIKIAGIVLNDFEPDISSKIYGYDYYAYYSHEGRKVKKQKTYLNNRKKL